MITETCLTELARDSSKATGLQSGALLFSLRGAGSSLAQVTQPSGPGACQIEIAKGLSKATQHQCGVWGFSPSDDMPSLALVTCPSRS